MNLSGGRLPPAAEALRWFAEIDARANFVEAFVRTQASADEAGGRDRLRHRDVGLGIHSALFNESAEHSHTRLFRAVELAEPAVKVDRRLANLGRMWSFMPYRAGLEELLEEVPVPVGRTVHAYVICLLLWGRTWSVFTRPAPREASDAAPRPVPGTGLPGLARADAAREVHLPIIAAKDLGTLVQAYELTATVQGADVPAGVAAILDASRLAIVHLQEDPSLTITTAFNLVRVALNDSLGGALESSPDDFDTTAAGLHRLESVLVLSLMAER